MTSLSCSGSKPTLLSPWRRRLQWTTSLLILCLPWIHIDGQSLLRIDIPHLSLYLFGQVLRIEELYLVLFFTLAFGLCFLLLTLVLGRVWCGWLCPQTTLVDLAEWMAQTLGLKLQHNRLRGALWRKIVVQWGYLLLSFLVAANLLWYFIEPRQFFVQLVSFDLHYAAWITLIVTALLLYLDLAVVRRLMCSEFCPYGRFQTALVDKATLTLHLPDSERNRCVECGSCVRACPMEIDIRRGYQVECINCGRCLDSCRQVMSKRGEPGLISYSFGLDNVGARALLNPRTLLLGVTTLVLLTLLTIAVVERPTASLKVSVSHTAAPRLLAEGQQGTFFNAWINNRSQAAAVYRLLARRSDTRESLVIKGQLQAELDPGENRRLDFIVLAPANERLQIEFVLIDSAELELAVAQAYIKKAVKDVTDD
jgi:polyferredoxin